MKSGKRRKSKSETCERRLFCGGEYFVDIKSNGTLGRKMFIDDIFHQHAHAAFAPFTSTSPHATERLQREKSINIHSERS